MSLWRNAVFQKSCRSARFVCIQRAALDVQQNLNTKTMAAFLHNFWTKTIKTKALLFKTFFQCRMQQLRKHVQFELFLATACKTLVPVICCAFIFSKHEPFQNPVHTAAFFCFQPPPFDPSWSDQHLADTIFWAKQIRDFSETLS